MAVLSPEEQARASQLKHQHRPRRSSTLPAHWCGECSPLTSTSHLKRWPSPRVGKASQEVVVDVDTPGSPRFSVSHSGSMALVALSRSHEVGPDIEQVRGDLVWRDIADKFFSLAELDALRDVPRADRRRAFYDCWVRKEALLERSGSGSAPVDHRLHCPDRGRWRIGRGSRGFVSPSRASLGMCMGSISSPASPASLAADGQAAVTIRPWPSVTRL